MSQPTPAAARWATYAAAASAAGLASTADAAIVYSGDQDILIPQFNSFNLNLDGDAYYDILLKNYVFGGNYQGATVNYAPGKVVGFTTGLNYATALAAGVTIDAAATAGGPFAVSLAYGNNPDSQFDHTAGAFIGLEFPINNVSHFGWIRVSIDNSAGTFIVNDWAYNDTPGGAIQTGQIPAPGSLGLLAAGALGVNTLRKRRKA